MDVDEKTNSTEIVKKTTVSSSSSSPSSSMDTTMRRGGGEKEKTKQIHPGGKVDVRAICLLYQWKVLTPLDSFNRWGRLKPFPNVPFE
ncbi:hypothetical protein CHUAL_003832 [Chamberlinius hualienensis]